MVGFVFTSRWLGALVRSSDAHPRRSNGVLASSQSIMLLPGLVLAYALLQDPDRLVYCSGGGIAQLFLLTYALMYLWLALNAHNCTNVCLGIGCW